MALYHYYVSDYAQSNGVHEVHREGCTFMPAEDERTYLGVFDNCSDAVKKAREYYAQSKGCYYCTKERHTS